MAFLKVDIIRKHHVIDHLAVNDMPLNLCDHEMFQP